MCIPIVALFTLELGSFFLLKISYLKLHYPDRTIHREQGFKVHKTISTFEKVHFCDFIHKSQKGQKLVSKYIDNSFNFKDEKNIWFFGGSTIEGRDCDDSQETFSDLLTKKYTKKIFSNYGKGGKNSDYSINLLKKKLALGEKPDLVMWGHWINEFLVNGDYRDHNFKKLNGDYDLKKNEKNHNLRKLILSSNLTLYKHSHFFRLTTNVLLNLKSTFSPFFFKVHLGGVASESSELVSLFPPAFKQDKKAWISYSLKNYKYNLDSLLELSKKNNFKIVLIYPPHIENYYKETNFGLNQFLEEEWYVEVKKLMINVSQGNDWQFIDLHEQFKNGGNGHRLTQINSLEVPEKSLE